MSHVDKDPDGRYLRNVGQSPVTLEGRVKPYRSTQRFVDWIEHTVLSGRSAFVKVVPNRAE